MNSHNSSLLRFGIESNSTKFQFKHLTFRHLARVFIRGEEKPSIFTDIQVALKTKTKKQNDCVQTNSQQVK